MLVGLQLPEIIDSLDGYGPGEVAVYAAAVIGTVVAVRFLWVFPASYLPRALSRRIRERDPWPGWQAPFAIAYTGMRGRSRSPRRSRSRRWSRAAASSRSAT